VAFLEEGVGVGVGHQEGYAHNLTMHLSLRLLLNTPNNMLLLLLRLHMRTSLPRLTQIIIRTNIVLTRRHVVTLIAKLFF
jgi:hypothetical protein